MIACDDNEDYDHYYKYADCVASSVVSIAELHLEYFLDM